MPAQPGQQAQPGLLRRIFSRAWNSTRVAGNWCWNHKKGVGYAAASIAAAGVVYFGYRKFSDSNVVFNDKINGSYVRYEEDRGLLFEENVMTIRKDGLTYTLIDSSDEHNLYWEENTPRFGEDRLERVEMRDDLGRLTMFNSADMGKDNLKGSGKAEDALRASNTTYNKIRGEIRERLRSRFIENCERLERDLGSLIE
jgi:hypothetical protein